LIASCQGQWFKQTLCQGGKCVVHPGIVKGQFHEHEHDKMECDLGALIAGDRVKLFRFFGRLRDRRCTA
jgi:hypothetical protein